MSTEKTLREAENIVEIEGIVQEIRIEEKSFKKKVDGKEVTNEVLTGEIDIKVNDDVHTVNVFSNKLNKEGKESGLYKGILTIKNEYKSIQSHGIEAADKVRITQGKIGLNEYVGQDGLVKSYPQLSANFINRLQANDTFTPKAKFTLEMCVAFVTDEKKQGEETGRVILKGYVSGYQGRAFPFELVVAGDRAVNYVSNNYDKGTTVKVFGNIINQVTETKKEIEVGFGQPQEKIDRKTVREYQVISGTEPIDSDDDKALDPKLIKKGLEAREKTHAEMIEKKKTRDAAQSGGSDSNPFAPNGTKNKDPFADDSGPISISEDDLPF